MSGGWFVTGTDTGVGKTRVAATLLSALARAGLMAVGMKPIASGCRYVAEGLRSEDAEILLAHGSVDADYLDVNPYAFAEPVAPHIVAAEKDVGIRLDVIRERFKRLQQLAQYVVVEGVGGWRVPLGDRYTVADLAKALDLPVILVVGMRLGCLNHALLSIEAINADGMSVCGWVANRIDPTMSRFDQNVAALERRIDAPLVGIFPHQAAYSSAAAIKRLNLKVLLPMHP